MSNTDPTTGFFTGQAQPEYFQPPVPRVAGNNNSSSSSSLAFGNDTQTQKGKNKSLKDITAGGKQGDQTDAGSSSKTRSRKKPDPSAAPVTAPCSECGRRFWSQKALFGHMRCHPERQWRGINPPPDLRRPQSPFESPPPPIPRPPSPQEDQGRLQNTEHEVAAYLVMMANGPKTDTTENGTMTTTPSPALSRHVNCRFECSSCKKVFGSHQALGGHRATHKNVKGCFAIARNEGEEASGIGCGNNDACGTSNVGGDDGQRAGEWTAMSMMGSEHRCKVCRRAFSSGQALGGQEGCHWERGDEQDASCSALPISRVPDLNLPPPLDNSGSSSETVLDLKLGI